MGGCEGECEVGYECCLCKTEYLAILSRPTVLSRAKKNGRRTMLDKKIHCMMEGESTGCYCTLYSIQCTA